MRSPAEYDAIRASNRAALGLAGVGPSTPHASRVPLGVSGTDRIPLGVSGYGDGLIGAALGAAGPIRVSSEFPDVSVEWDPSQPGEAPQQEGSGVGWWLTTRVVRPKFQGAGVTYEPGAGHPNYSGIARALAWAAAFAAAAATAWVGWRAFGPRRRSNPRRVGSATRYYVVTSAGRRRVA